MSRYKIVITDYYYADLSQEMSVFSQLDDCEVEDLTKIVPGGIKDPDALIPYLKDCDAVIVQFATINSKVIDSMTRCKVISRYAIGVDTIDIEAATRKNIYVANVPNYCIDEVANTAAAHLLNAFRKINVARDMLIDGSFSMNAIEPLYRMKNCTLCLLGFGNIARNLYHKMRPFFERIVAYDPYFKEKEAYPDVSFMSLQDAVSCADAISIHVPLSDETRGMINAEVIAAAKNGVILVNTARGGLIDDSALMEALGTGKIGFAGLDVIDGEDFFNSPYLHLPNVCLTPHFGWNSVESGMELQRKTALNVVETLKNGKPNTYVNLKNK